MANNPLLRFGGPRAAGIACTLGVTGDFPAYTSGQAYTGTVSIAGAQGATTVALVPPGTDANGGAYIPLANGDFSAGSSSWAVTTQTASPGFSFQSGAGRSGPGFLRWQTTAPMTAPDGDLMRNTTVVQTTERTTTGRFWARCTAIGTTSATVYAQVAVQMEVFADAACTQFIGSKIAGFLRFFEVLDWRPIVSDINTAPGQYVRFTIWVYSNVACTLEFDDAEWDGRGIPAVAPSALALPAGFTIDTVTSPDRVRVQWPATATPGTSTLPNLGMETGDVNWLKGAGWTISTGGLVDAGTWSAKYNGVGQSNIVHETMAPVAPGTTITASCRISKGNNRQDFAGGAVLLQWFDANTRIISFNVGNVVNTGTAAFQTSTVTATAPAGAAFVRIGASGTRDVKGRASDVVAVDGFSWNHTFTLGGTGGAGATAPTGPIALTFRVQDAQGCSAVATRTIGQAPLSNGTWIAFARPQGSGSADSYSIASAVPTSWGGTKRPTTVGGIGRNIHMSGAGGGNLYAVEPGGPFVIRSGDLGASWTVTALDGVAGQQRIDVRNGRVIASMPSDFQYSDDAGVTRVVSLNSPMRQRHLYGASSIVGGAFDLILSTDNGTTRNLISGFPTFGRSIQLLIPGGTHLVAIGGPAGAANQFSRVPIETPTISHTPFTVAAVPATDTWNGTVAPCAAYGNGIFVAVTDQGRIVRSTDEGATWTVSAFVFPNPRSLVFGDGVFMIVGDAGAIRTSTDGNTWTAVASGAFGTDNITNAIFVPH